MNLKQETLNILNINGKSWADVRFVSNGQYAVKNLDKFLDDMDFEYDDSYGCAEIDIKLKIVGDNWWLERYEYDGSEWWVFKTLPIKPEEQEMRFVEDYGRYKLLPVDSTNK